MSVALVLDHKFKKNHKLKLKFRLSTLTFVSGNSEVLNPTSSEEVESKKLTYNYQDGTELKIIPVIK